MNAKLIHLGLSQGERLTRLNAMAIRQMHVLATNRVAHQLARTNRMSVPT